MIYPEFYETYKEIVSKYDNIILTDEVTEMLKEDLNKHFSDYAKQNNLIRTGFYFNIIMDILETYDRRELLKDIESIINDK